MADHPFTEAAPAIPTVAVYKASGTRRAAPPVAIVIAEPIPGDDPALRVGPDESRAIFARDAGRLAEALWGSLPGGTIDALIGRLMQRRASLLHCPFPDGRPRSRA